MGGQCIHSQRLRTPLAEAGSIHRCQDSAPFNRQVQTARFSHLYRENAVANESAATTRHGRDSRLPSLSIKAALHQNGCNSLMVDNLVLSGRVSYSCHLLATSQ